MKIIKLVLISAVVLCLLLTAIAGLLPSQVRISRAIDIRAPAAEISTEIVRLENWQHWNEYIIKMKDRKLGSDSITGNQLVIKLVDKKSGMISTSWQQKDGKVFKGVFNLIGHDSNTTTVQWYFDFRFGWYPWEKLSSIIYDEQLGPPMQQSLENLKQLIENVP